MQRTYKIFYIVFIVVYSIVQFLIGRISVSSVREFGWSMKRLIIAHQSASMKTPHTSPLQKGFLLCFSMKLWKLKLWSITASSSLSLLQLKKEFVSTLYFFIFLYTISIYFVQFEVSPNYKKTIKKESGSKICEFKRTKHLQNNWVNWLCNTKFALRPLTDFFFSFDLVLPSSSGKPKTTTTKVWMWFWLTRHFCSPVWSLCSSGCSSTSK